MTLARLLLILAVAALACGSVLTWPRTVDDAYITYRYARNLVDGLGPNFNPGERVEGYSSPSFLLLMAAAIAAGIDPVPASKALGVASSVVLLFAVYGGLRRAGVEDWGAGAAALVLGSSAVLQIWSSAGLETNAYALLFFVGLHVLSERPLNARSALVASASLVAAALTRPEGLVFWALGLVVVFVWAPEPAGEAIPSSRLSNGLAYSLPGLLLAVHAVWRIAYYGELLPNTYFVKTGGGAPMWRQGLHGLGLFASNPSHVAWLLAAAAGAVVGATSFRERRRVTILSGAVILHLLYVVSVGDDGLRIHRFYVPVLAPLAFLLGLLFRRVAPGRRGIRPLLALGAVAGVITIAASLLTLRAETVVSQGEGALIYQEGNERLGRLLAERQRPDAVIAVAAAGAIPYYSRLRAMDMYGLNDRHIARQPFPAGGSGRLMKWDNAYVLSRRPDLIVINRGYFRAGDPLAKRVLESPGILATTPMDRDLFRRVERDGSYALRSIRFPDGAQFYVFERIPSYTAAPAIPPGESLWPTGTFETSSPPSSARAS